MKIWYLSEKKRKESSRELTDEEKDIMSTGCMVGAIYMFLIIFYKISITSRLVP